jgi:chorismate synthase
MMNSFGRLFRVSIFGESHGACTGVCIDGCPPGILLAEADFETDLKRRKSGGKGTTARTEADQPKIMSGVYNGCTTGAPLTILFGNTDTRSGDYSFFSEIPRPGHADFVSGIKYRGFADLRGSGHFSGRITVGLVAAGVVAKKIIFPVTVKAEITEINGNTDWEEVIGQCIMEEDSVGGIVECVAENIPAGLGEPFFDSVESVISHIVFAIPAIKGIEFGAGFAASRMKGSEHNDALTDAGGKTKTNHAGGINGGITNANPLIFRVAVKPTSSIGKSQKTINVKTGKLTSLKVSGRHDACIALRVPPVLEAAAAIALADLLMIGKCTLHE